MYQPLDCTFVNLLVYFYYSVDLSCFIVLYRYACVESSPRFTLRVYVLCQGWVSSQGFCNALQWNLVMFLYTFSYLRVPRPTSLPLCICITLIVCLTILPIYSGACKGPGTRGRLAAPRKDYSRSCSIQTRTSRFKNSFCCYSLKYWTFWTIGLLLDLKNASSFGSKFRYLKKSDPCQWFINLTSCMSWGRRTFTFTTQRSCW